MRWLHAVSDSLKHEIVGCHTEPTSLYMQYAGEHISHKW